MSTGTNADRNAASVRSTISRKKLAAAPPPFLLKGMQIANDESLEAATDEM